MKSGTLIAFAAGSLFASACEKKDDSAAGKPAKQPAQTTPADKPDPGKAEAEVKPDPAAGTPVEKPADVPAEKTSQVDCGGVNECKGQGTCRTEKHGCAGQNACKGQGVLAMTEAECEQKGGTIAARH